MYTAHVRYRCTLHMDTTCTVRLEVNHQRLVNLGMVEMEKAFLEIDDWVPMTSLANQDMLG